ncbi:MAG: glycosyltransferase, partial [Bacteroidia bacterium]|nr:glycosyltransferase [Bacteroidia bacterium]
PQCLRVNEFNHSTIPQLNHFFLDLFPTGSSVFCGRKPKPTKAIDLSVIIVNYNVKHYLSQCIHAVLRACEGISAEVFVVDNASTDGSVEMLTERFGDRIKLMANVDNPGFAKANNQAMRVAQGRYFLLLNPDTLVAEDSFRACITYMDAHPQAGGLGVYMHDGHGSFLPESKRALPTPWVSFYKIFGLANLFPKSKRFGQYHLSYLDKQDSHEIEILSGAYMWMRKETLDKVGLLDETYFMYGEDIDLSWRIIQGGYRNVYFAGTKILHYKGESTKKGSLNYVKVFYQAMIIFAKRHFGGRNRASFIFAIRVAVYLRAFLAIMQRFVKRFGFPMLEGSMIYGILYGVQAYWAHYVKYVVGGEYPAVFMQLYMPVYAAIFVGFLALTGAYKRPFRLRPLLMAPVWGFIAIATATYMFPFIQNFSRAIVGLGAVFTSLLGLGLRGVINWRENGHFFFTERSRKRVLLVGTDAEVDDMISLIRSELDYPVDVVGAATAGNPRKTNRLGDPADLSSLIRLFDVEEVIFANRQSSAGSVLAQMQALDGMAVEMKILPPEDAVLIGPQTIITPQVGRGMSEALRRPEQQRQKRTFDLVTSAFLLGSFPLLFWAYEAPTRAFAALISVLRGNNTLVGYSENPPADAPTIPPGYLALPDRLQGDKTSGISPEALNRSYAQDYRWELDLEIVWRAWRRIGKGMRE